MKKIISKDAALLLQTVAVLLLLSLLIAFLYMLDWIGTGLFTMITQLIGLLIYTAAAFFFLRWFPKRILLFALLACGAAVGIYFGCRSFLGTETLSWLCMVGAAPFAALGFIRYNGMTAEQLVRAWFRSEVRMPRRLLFRGTNTLVRAEKRGNK